MDIFTVAGEVRAQFERKARDNGTFYYTVRDQAPAWISDMARTVHGDMLPDDFKYEVIVHALDYIYENVSTDVDPAEMADLFADSEVDTYTADRFNWLGSHLSRAGYVDDAYSEFFSEAWTGVADLVGAGQYMECREVYGEVVAYLDGYVRDRG